ncbi:methylated-DNA-protein-cysteine methyltransferase [Vibrio ishigakensis]|uniref:Methylated-DNA--protein-cysteine methyltransferase n=1 Tax=Vibrio ishigakensis TaxID=1481914 RepID=A0A0B8PHQ2_9VIBR|nr:methylated-DNA-protein-cysteine methyltransferase [Vibrio ishigakensis]
MLYYNEFDSALGIITVQTSDKGIKGIWFETYTTKPDELGEHTSNHPILVSAKKQLSEYLNSERAEFDLPLDADGTEFQKQVWSELAKIPFGETRSYKQIAEAINKPKAVRAVGAANGKNPVSVVVPCHRVVGSNRALTGYAGGIERKKKLLELENIEL